MGCGESKHAVSTENTLTKTKSKSKSFKNSSPPSEKAANDANVDPTSTVQEPSNEVKGSADGVENKKDERYKGRTEKPGEKVKGGDENAKANEAPTVAAKVEENKEEEKGKEAAGRTKEDGEMKGVGDGKAEAEEKADIVDQEVIKLASEASSDHHISPKRDHGETVDTIISGGISSKSDCYSPRAKAKTEEKVEEGGEAKPDAEKAAEVIKVDDTEKAEVPPAEVTKVDESEKVQATRAEVTKVDEAKQVEAIDETGVSTNVGDEKTTVAGDENAEATPSNDVKAN